MLRFASTRTACLARLSRATKLATSRQFHAQSTLLDAQVFKMPAMSPTMEEGGIVGWKVEPGQEFSAGDVLLEVETDKATIDVEAQDDGIMWEILKKDGANGIAVGEPIALLAEHGDDLSSLERPNLEQEAAAPKREQPKQEKPKEETNSDSTPQVVVAQKSEPSAKPETPSNSSSDSVFVSANPLQKLTPAVELLLHTKGISVEEALQKIPASGPKGRLLKGDVLAYLGDISKSAVERVATYFKSKEHLDLSNIKIAKPKEEPASAQETKKVEPLKPANILSIGFTFELGDNISEFKFQHAFEKALHTAITQTYGHRFPEYSRSPSASGVDLEEIFDDLLVAPPTKQRFEVSDVQFKFIKPASSRHASAPLDAFDELLGIESPTPIVHEVDSPVTADVKFKVKFDEKLIDSKEFVEDFQENLLSQIPTKQLIITQV